MFPPFEGNTDADLARALRHKKRQHPKQPNGGEQQRECGECSHQTRFKTWIHGGFTDDLLHGEDIRDGKFRVDASNRFLNRIESAAGLAVERTTKAVSVAILVAPEKIENHIMLRAGSLR